MVSLPLAAIATTPGISFASHFWRNSWSISDLVCIGGRLLKIFCLERDDPPPAQNVRQAARPPQDEVSRFRDCAAPDGAGAARPSSNSSSQSAVDEFQDR